jgi:hypothetical protein
MYVVSMDMEMLKGIRSLDMRVSYLPVAKSA